MGYMTTNSKSTTRAWWEEHSDPSETRAALDAYRAAQREQAMAAWRRIAMLGILAVTVPILIRMLTAA
jgi:4-alpha-glucanotransferase